MIYGVPYRGGPQCKVYGDIPAKLPMARTRAGHILCQAANNHFCHGSITNYALCNRSASAVIHTKGLILPEKVNIFYAHLKEFSQCKEGKINFFFGNKILGGLTFNCVFPLYINSTVIFVI